MISSQSKNKMDELEEQAVSATPIKTPNWASRLNNPGNSLLDYYKRYAIINDLQAAILKAELTVSMTPKNHPDRAEGLNTLVNLLSDRLCQTGNIDDM